MKITRFGALASRFSKRGVRLSKSYGQVAFICAAIQLGVVQPAFSESVNLLQAYNRMVESGLEFGMIDADLEASAELVKQAKGQRLPKIEIALQYDQIQQQVISSDNTAYATGKSQYPKISMNFTVRQPLYDAVRFRQLPLAKAQDAVRRADAEVARNRAVRDMIVAYFGVAQAQLGVDRAKLISKGRSDYEVSISEDIDAGRRESDALLRAQSDTLSAQSDEMDAEIGMVEALAELQRYAGLDVTGVAVNGSKVGLVDLSSLKREMTEANLLSMSPDVQSARASFEVSKRQKLSAKGAMQPSVDLVLDMERQVTEGSLFGGGSETQTITGGVLLTVPIYEGGIKKSRVREAEAGIKSAELKMRLSEKAVKARYKALMNAAQVTAKRNGVLAKQMRLTETSVQVAREQLVSGRASEGVVLEQTLRRDVLRMDMQATRMQQMRVQAELYALFGALDMKTISKQAGG